MTEIKPNEVHAATAELTSDATLRLVRNGVAQEGVDKLSLCLLYTSDAADDCSIV